MRLPKTKPAWKRLQANDIREAFRLCKAYGRQFNQLSTERIADLMGVTVDQLYKWLGTGKMPSNLIPNYEHICGAHYVSDYLAAFAHRLVIEMPSGAPAGPDSIADMQGAFAKATQLLIEFYRDEADAEATGAAITTVLKQLAGHRANVAKAAEGRELDLFGGEDE